MSPLTFPGWSASLPFSSLMTPLKRNSYLVEDINTDNRRGGFSTFISYVTANFGEVDSWDSVNVGPETECNRVSGKVGLWRLRHCWMLRIQSDCEQREKLVADDESSYNLVPFGVEISHPTSAGYRLVVQVLQEPCIASETAKRARYPWLLW